MSSRTVRWAGGLLFGAAFLVLGLVQAAQFAVDDYGADAQAAKALFALGWNTAAVLGPPVAAIVAPWIPVFVLWVLLVSVSLLVEGRRPGPAAGTPSG